MRQQRKTMAVAYAALVVALILAIVAWRYYRRPSTPMLTSQDVADEMKLRAKRAVDSALADFEITLDYSPESVEDVEAILAKLHDEHKTSEFERARLTKEALKWGAYVGEVIKTQRRCEWALDSKIGGPGSLPIVYDKGESFPVRWCYKRIVNGKEENVWHKFAVLVLDHDKTFTAIFPPEASDAGSNIKPDAWNTKRRRPD